MDLRPAAPQRPTSLLPIAGLLLAALAGTALLWRLHGRALRRPPERTAAERPSTSRDGGGEPALPPDLLARLRAVRDGGRFPFFRPEEWEAASAAFAWLGSRPLPSIERAAAAPPGYREWEREEVRSALRGRLLRVEGKVVDLRPVDLAGEGPPAAAARPGVYAYLVPDGRLPSGFAVYALEAGSLRRGDLAAACGVFLKLAYTYDGTTGERAHHPVFLAKRVAFAPK